MLRRKLQKISTPKFQSTFSTVLSSVYQDKGTRFQLSTPGHRSEQCNGSTCKKCTRKQNNLLHLEANNNSSTASTATVTTSSTSPQEANSQASKTISKGKEKITAEEKLLKEEKEVFLPNAIVPLDNNGKTTELRAILDSGSQSNLITQDSLHCLGLKKKPTAEFFLTRTSRSQQQQKSVKVVLKSEDEDFIRIRATVLTKLTSNLPSHYLKVSSWTNL